jgi:hypothetical protein
MGEERQDPSGGLMYNQFLWCIWNAMDFCVGWISRNDVGGNRRNYSFDRLLFQNAWYAMHPTSLRHVCLFCLLVCLSVCLLACSFRDSLWKMSACVSCTEVSDHLTEKSRSGTFWRQTLKLKDFARAMKHSGTGRNLYAKLIDVAMLFVFRKATHPMGEGSHKRISLMLGHSCLLRLFSHVLPPFCTKMRKASHPHFRSP